MAGQTPDATRGALYPERLPEFTRVPATGDTAELVEWFWIPVWDLPAGERSPQRTLAYPAANLVVEDDTLTLWGPSSRVARRDLTGRGWAVGALLRPAALAALCAQPADLVDGHVRLDAPELVAAVGRVMPQDLPGAVGILSEWIGARAGTPTGEGRLANEMARLLMTDATVLRLEDAAARLSVSPRTLQRLAHRTVGMPPAAMIRRRRLQEAAQRVREEPAASLAAIAVELGYSDQAHLAGDFRTVLGLTATEYRAGR
ncbi:AraC family transcriptional regulator [Microbacterium mangrovi]|uniref:AraC family transcriptional regulator n=1 Tax=Microbacterium mangrovi TaxID=1348253 RepID=A0A0B2A4R2_9MICO|nr:helix-turn-helix domain-containing protein [Microbacterium mangrovi]KHK98484.1 AraC family transcriptional regulator [Microbacterium mangrovi]